MEKSGFDQWKYQLKEVDGIRRKMLIRHQWEYNQCNWDKLVQGTNARKVNCGHVYSAYILKPVIDSGRTL